jgi:predicted RNA-binding Zn-ribbon protein involved in translation (DUF1610 family)
MAKWIFTGLDKKLQTYRCSACGYTKTILHPIKSKRKNKNDGTPYKFRCPKCGEEIEYEN